MSALEINTINGTQAQAKKDYYKGSQEKAHVSAVTKKKLQKRAQLTQRSDKLVIVMVGLPGRGKSFMSRKLTSYFTWKGSNCKCFNVGQFRREFTARKREDDRKAKRDSAILQTSSSAGGASANFFDSENVEAKNLREEVAMYALKKLLAWLNDGDDKTERVGIFDATNSTRERRESILRVISKNSSSQIGVLFLESVCDDAELLEDNFLQKVRFSPDFQGMSEEAALADLKERVKKYEAAYETIDNDDISYIKVFNLSSKVLANQIYGRMSKSILPALMMWHVGNRPIWFCRAGQTLTEEKLRKGLGTKSPSVSSHSTPISNNSVHSRSGLRRGDTLGNKGIQFRDALSKFFAEEGINFMYENNDDNGPKMNIGTSSGVGPSLMNSIRASSIAAGIVLGSSSEDEDCSDTSGESYLDFPCKIMCSTMPRALETVTWERTYFEVEQYSNLNPLDKGDYAGCEIEDIKEIYPVWYQKLEQDPYNTRFPGGESYKDLVNRLESCLIDMEQQVSPVLVVSHVSVIQCLLAYFRNSPIHECTSIEVPLHTVIEMTPMKGAGWSERHINLMTNDARSVVSSPKISMSDDEPSSPKTPIWGDHVKKEPTVGIEGPFLF